jgi:hypothetical protein
MAMAMESLQELVGELSIEAKLKSGVDQPN